MTRRALPVPRHYRARRPSVLTREEVEALAASVDACGDGYYPDELERGAIRKLCLHWKRHKRGHWLICATCGDKQPRDAE